MVSRETCFPTGRVDVQCRSPEIENTRSLCPESLWQGMSAFQTDRSDFMSGAGFPMFPGRCAVVSSRSGREKTIFFQPKMTLPGEPVRRVRVTNDFLFRYVGDREKKGQGRFPVFCNGKGTAPGPPCSPFPESVFCEEFQGCSLISTIPKRRRSAYCLELPVQLADFFSGA